MYAPAAGSEAGLGEAEALCSAVQSPQPLVT
jgi:hypothetical protein